MAARATRQAGDADVLLSLLPALRLRYCPLRPTARQEAFLLLHDREGFFGGAAGGGKSVAMLMGGLQYADVPGYHALLLRPSLAELQLAGGLIELAHDWLQPTKARWSGDSKTWRFPGRGRSGSGGATLTFGYLADASDVARYAGTSYSFLGFDELTRFQEADYRRMFRVLRQPVADRGGPAAPDGTTLNDVPVRVRATSNPGGPGHAWVKDRFINPETRHPDAVYLPSRITDNPHLDTATYLETLAELPTAERERLMHGDWEIPDDGDLFKRDWFVLVEPHQLPTSGLKAVRYWDLAATEPSPANRDPDWTVGLRLDRHQPSGDYYITDIVRERKGPGAIEQLVRATAKRDGRDTAIVVEQEPGAAGVHAADRYKRHVLAGHTVRTVRPTGDKLTRATPVAAAAENGLLKLVRGRHHHAFLDELTAFPHGRHDDCIDALAGAHHALTRYAGYGTISIPRGRIDADPLRHTRSWAERRYLRDPNGEHLAALLGAHLYPAPPRGRRTVRRRVG
jgi:predicted phage terminase large subunit-like protein